MRRVERGELAPIRAFRVLTNVDLSRIRYNHIQYTRKDLEETVIVPPVTDSLWILI